MLDFHLQEMNSNVLRRSQNKSVKVTEELFILSLNQKIELGSKLDKC